MLVDLIYLIKNLFILFQIKKERLQKLGLNFPIEYPEKERNIHYNSNLPIHKRYERKKEMHPIELGVDFV